MNEHKTDLPVAWMATTGDGDIHLDTTRDGVLHRIETYNEATVIVQLTPLFAGATQYEAERIAEQEHARIRAQEQAKDRQEAAESARMAVQQKAASVAMPVTKPVAAQPIFRSRMIEIFEESGAGGNWEYPVDSHDPSVAWALKIWIAAWSAALEGHIKSAQEKQEARCA